MTWWQTIADIRPHDLAVGDPAAPYMLRWHLVPRNAHANVYLHKFLRDDEDRALHDHPWASRSWLLSGALREIDADHPEGQLLTAGAYRERSAVYAHRLEVVEPGFSLFITGPRVREWGFHCPQGFVPWHAFVNPDNPGEVGPGCGEVGP